MVNNKRNVWLEQEVHTELKRRAKAQKTTMSKYLALLFAKEAAPVCFHWRDLIRIILEKNVQDYYSDYELYSYFWALEAQGGTQDQQVKS